MSDGGGLGELTPDAGGGDAGTYTHRPSDAGAADAGMFDASMPPPEVDDAGPPIPLMDASVLDAGMVTSDAGSSMPPPILDAGLTTSDAGVDAAAARSCAAGQQLGGHCWFLGAVNQSCNDACGAHGGYEPSLYWIGSGAQGGTLARCDQLLTLLTGSGTTTAGHRTDGRGLGCHLYTTARWWLSTPDFDPAARLRNTRVVCSCLDD